MSFAHDARSDYTAAYSAPVDRSLGFGRLARNTQTLIAAHPKVTALGPDDVVEHLADKHGFGRFDLSIHRVSLAGRICSLVCVPESITRDPKSRSQLLALKLSAAATGHSVVLVPERVIQRQPRLSNCRMIEQSAEICIRAEDRMAVLIHLIENGYSTIIDCAAAVRHEAPFSVVFYLIAEGVLSVRTDKRIGPNSRVDLVEAGSA